MAKKEKITKTAKAPNISLFRCALAVFFFLVGVVASKESHATITAGNEESAKKYYREAAAFLGFSTSDGIFKTTLDDVAAYLGYAGITGVDFQNLPPSILMNPSALLTPCGDANGKCPNSLRDTNAVIKSLGAIPIRPDDILITQFFAPKIMNIKDPEATRKLGWRKLVRLRARLGSAAQKHHIESGIILFNILTEPGAIPFSPTDESFNTQVMLITDAASVSARGSTQGQATLYWLDYDRLSKGGLLSLKLDASFEANDLPQPKSYFVPDGCIACHGNNSQRSMVNYLDTDHWIDRLENDFPALKAQGLPLLVDANTNDPNALSYKFAFDVIRRFNEEADSQVSNAQPKHDEALSSKKWLEIHKESGAYFTPTARATGALPVWSKDKPNEVKALGLLNQYCFRCHGTVKFSVFDLQAVKEQRPFILQRIKADAPIGFRMPPDRDLPEDVRNFLHDSLPKKEKP